jgi:putative tricarboxylic transport membrane protein
VQRPDVVWGLIAALYIGNVMLLILNLPLVGIFVRLLYLPMWLLLPLIMVISVIGVYSASQSMFDLYMLAGMGVLGFYLRRNHYPVAPVILGFVLGGRMEEAIRQSMILTRGDFLLVLERPIVVVFLVLAVIAMVVPLILQRARLQGKPVQLEQEEA